jgi:hypothetical protein
MKSELLDCPLGPPKAHKLPRLGEYACFGLGSERTNQTRFVLRFYELEISVRQFLSTIVADERQLSLACRQESC